MFKWAVFAVMWIAGLFAGDVLAASGIAGIGSRLVFFGGMWMLACIGVKECIAIAMMNAERSTPGVREGSGGLLR